MQICEVDNCHKELTSKDCHSMCQKHRWRLKTYGDVTYKRAEKQCSVQNCTNKHKAHGLCSLHYRRIKNNLPLHFEAKFLAKKRYKVIVAQGHPLASKKTGRILLHRKVLFDSIGFSIVPCFWCAKGLLFGVNLFVDHLDHDRHNNELKNLVPSCNSCNAGRTYANPRVRQAIYEIGEI